jgi:hypothetical protein
MESIVHTKYGKLIADFMALIVAFHVLLVTVVLDILLKSYPVDVVVTGY